MGDDNEVKFDYAKLNEVVQSVTISMNKVIDNHLYILEQARASDMKNRPIGIGVQGLSEVTKLRETDEQQEIAIAGDANEERLSDVEQRLDVEVMRTAGRVEILRSQRVCGDHPRSTEKSNNNGGYEQLPGR
ncbi:Ribonucleoside-diphosphate reductase [Phytophthora nicotianae]|uniref:Ribonucleoside-diphosphate reductase n=1 Tax=Phytophthora nicotianae TaxID=4792 RepID=A0A0W8CCP2_PHYNI|nr:Ribonucleoside-diphosphate reductase [Phytophthora nicotianae]